MGWTDSAWDRWETSTGTPRPSAPRKAGDEAQEWVYDPKPSRTTRTPMPAPPRQPPPEPVRSP